MKKLLLFILLLLPFTAHAQIDGSQIRYRTNAQTGTTYAVSNIDRGKLVTFSNASAIAVTLPRAGTSGLFPSGWYADFSNIGVGTVTITPTVSNIDGNATLTLTTGQSARLISNGTNYRSAAKGTGSGGGGATVALDNLASVALNTAFLPGTAGAISLGSGTKPFQYFFMSGTSSTSGTNNFQFIGASTGGTRTVSLPDANTLLPISSQRITWAGLTAARTITFPDASITVARSDAANTFTGTQTFSGDILAANITASSQTIYMNSGQTVFMKAGTGSPEGVVTGAIGSVWLRTDGSTNTSIYRKETGAGNTGWIAVSNAAGSGGGDALVANPLSQFAATTSAQLAGVITDESGTGVVTFTISPTLVTPNLGTPSAVVLTNGTGLPISTGVSGLGTGVATFLATPTSANLATAITNETGTGSAVFATSPTLVTPNLGTPSAAVLTSATGLPLTTGVTGTLPVANGGTGIASGTSGGIPYYSGSTTIASSAAMTLNAVVKGGGAGVAPIASGVSIDSSNNVSTPGQVTTGAGGGVSGNIALSGSTSGTANISVAAAAGTGTFNLPVTGASTHTLADLDSGQTLTSKTLTNPAITVLTLTDGATINWDLNSGNMGTITLGGNRTLAAPTNIKTGSSIALKVIQDGTGSRTLTWNAVFKWPGAVAPPLSTGAGKIDLVTCASFDGSTFQCNALLDLR